MPYLIISFKNSFAYRASVIFGICNSIFFVLIQIALWTFIYQNDSSKISYMTSYVILSNIISLFYSNGMSGAIAGKISSGSLANDLIRPNNFIAMNYFTLLGGMFSNFILKGIPLVIIYSPFLVVNMNMSNPSMLLFALMAIILGHVIYILLYTMIGFMAFIFIEIWPFSALIDDTIRFISGAIIPIALFPSILRTISNFLPFRFLYAFPLELILNDIGRENIISNFVIMVSWIAVLGCVLLMTYKAAVNKLVVQGG